MLSKKRVGEEVEIMSKSILATGIFLHLFGELSCQSWTIIGAKISSGGLRIGEPISRPQDSEVIAEIHLSPHFPP